MANTKFVTIDDNGAQHNQELGASVPGATANPLSPAPLLIVPFDVIGNASTTVGKVIPVTEGSTWRIVGIDIVKAAQAGGVGDLISATNGASTIGTLSLNGLADNGVGSLTINDASFVYTAGTTLSVSTTKAVNDPSCYAYVKLLKLT